MRLFWWQQLPLLILIQLLETNGISPKIYVGGLKQSSGRIERYPCLRQSAFVNCYKLKDPGFVSLIPGTYPLPLQTRLPELSSFAVNLLAPNSPIQLQEKYSKSRNRRITTMVDGDSNVPTLTPLQETDIKKPRKQKFAAIVGGIGAALLVLLIIVLVYVCLMRVRRNIRQTSEAGSSVPSPSDLERVRTSSCAGAPLYDTQNLRQLTISELEHATCNFSQNNIIGEGLFGLVYKGLLQDGSIMAIKRRLHTPTQYLVHELNRIARIQHKHLVKLVGYYEDSHQQILVYDYIPNGNVGIHLYDSEGLPIGRLNMQQRLLIALGAAKGLEHLHSLVPPLLHMHFITRNVLLDENFTAKVSDYGLSKLVNEGHQARSSSTIDCFLDPELSTSKNFSAGSNVYSFGVFLLELISGHEAHGRNQSNSEQNLILQARTSGSLISFVDKTLGENIMYVAEQMIKLALECIDLSSRRPSMRSVVEELEGIQERELGHLHSEFEEIGPVTLGSELFK